MIHGIYQMNPRQFCKAINAGVFGEKRVELLGGIPFIMSQNPPHTFASRRLFAALQVLAILPRWVVDKEVALTLGRWRPIADTAVLRGPDTIYSTRLARASDVALLVEVSDTTYVKDSGPMLRRYASFRIPVYWIVEVRTGPYGRWTQAGYTLCHTYREGDVIPVELDGQEVGRVAVSDLLP